MIPTYRPGPFLLETLRSVLEQDLGPQRMEIEVVDDASPDLDDAALAALVARADPQRRVRIHRAATNAGLAGNWNRCVERARGEWVHILHQDDRVRPSFYRRMLSGLDSFPQALMGFCRCEFIDARGAVLGASRRRAWRAGIMRHWLARISEATRVQCPGVLVRRSTYERLGGYRTDLRYALDWEMWVRIAAAGDVYYEPRALASYRKHAGNETTRLEASALADTDVLKAIGIFARALPDERRTYLLGRAYREFVRLRLRHSKRALQHLEPSRLRSDLESARRLMREVPAADSWRNRWRLHQLERRLAVRGS
jgi:GT2 family glycosyltransferase